MYTSSAVDCLVDSHLEQAEEPVPLFLWLWENSNAIWVYSFYLCSTNTLSLLSSLMMTKIHKHRPGSLPGKTDTKFIILKKNEFNAISIVYVLDSQVLLLLLGFQNSLRTLTIWIVNYLLWFVHSSNSSATWLSLQQWWEVVSNRMFPGYSVRVIVNRLMPFSCEKSPISLMD